MSRHYALSLILVYAIDICFSPNNFSICWQNLFEFLIATREYHTIITYYRDDGSEAHHSECS